MANFPTSISTDANLYVAVNGLQTTLSSNITSSQTSIPLNSTTNFPTTGAVTINNAEVVFYTGISGGSLTGCTRGADGTTPLAANLGQTVGATIVAFHHNGLKNEIEAIETSLGVNMGNVFPATPTTGTGNVVLQTSPTLITPALGTPSSVVLTNATGIPNSATTATSSPTANDIVSRDANANTQVNTIVENFSTTTTAAGTTALTVSSSPIQQFTGTTTQTVTLPDATTLTVGYQISVLNRSTGTVSVNNHGGTLQQAISAGGQNVFTVTSISTSNGVWDVSTTGTNGTVTSVSGTANQITSTNPTTTPTLALANPLTTPGGVTVSGNLTFTPTTNGVVGTTTNDNTAAGNVGEYVVSSTTSPGTTLTNNQYNDVTNISLTAGDWDITGIISFTQPTSGTVTACVGGIGTASGNSTSGLVVGNTSAFVGAVPNANTDATVTIAAVRKSISTTTTFYLKCDAGFSSGSISAYGRISARRIR